MTTFHPNLALPLPGDFDSTTTGGTGTIDNATSRLHSTTTSTDPESRAFATKDVFGATGVDEVSLRFTLQEVLGQPMPSNLYTTIRVTDTVGALNMDVCFQIGREPFLRRGFGFASALLPAIDTSSHRFLLCMNRVTGDYSFQMDAAIISGNTLIGGKFRTVSFGTVGDHAAFPESFHHEMYTSAITVRDGACPPFNESRCVNPNREPCPRSGGTHAGAGKCLECC